MSETHLSQTAYARLQDELEDLTTTGRTKIAIAIERARELGDLSENGDYHAAKDDQGEKYLIGSIEERHDDLAVISPGSPLGQALMGHGPGETVQYEAPGGNLQVEIVEVGATA
jgi:transcription elongation factor GreA